MPPLPARPPTSVGSGLQPGWRGRFCGEKGACPHLDPQTREGMRSAASAEPKAGLSAVLVEGAQQCCQESTSCEYGSSWGPLSQSSSLVRLHSGQGVRGFKKTGAGAGEYAWRSGLSELWFPPLENENNITAS